MYYYYAHFNNQPSYLLHLCREKLTFYIAKLSLKKGIWLIDVMWSVLQHLDIEINKQKHTLLSSLLRGAICLL